MHPNASVSVSRPIKQADPGGPASRSCSPRLLEIHQAGEATGGRRPASSEWCAQHPMVRVTGTEAG